jgi:hypothetical protein
VQIHHSPKGSRWKWTLPFCMPRLSAARSVRGLETASVKSITSCEPHVGQVLCLAGKGPAASCLTGSTGCAGEAPVPANTEISRCSMWSSTRRLLLTRPPRLSSLHRKSSFVPIAHSRRTRKHRRGQASLPVVQVVPHAAGSCLQNRSQEFSIFLNAAKSLRERILEPAQKLGGTMR